MAMKLRIDDIKIYDCRFQLFESECQWLCEILQFDRNRNFISVGLASWQAETDGQTNVTKIMTTFRNVTNGPKHCTLPVNSIPTL
jgi:hypothetical protein